MTEKDMEDEKLKEISKRLITENSEDIYKTLRLIRDSAYSVGYKHGKEDVDFASPDEEDGPWAKGWEERSGQTKGNEIREHYDPKGIEFVDKATLREMKFVTEGHSKGWICYKHPDGQWVTLREATEEDKRVLGVSDNEIRDVVYGAHGVKKVCPECNGTRTTGENIGFGSIMPVCLACKEKKGREVNENIKDTN